MKSYGKTYEIHVYSDLVSPMWLQDYYKDGDELFKNDDHWVDFGDCFMDDPEAAIYSVEHDPSFMRTIAVTEDGLQVYETVVHEFDCDQDGRVIDNGAPWKPYYIGKTIRVLCTPDPHDLKADYDHYFDTLEEAKAFAIEQFEKLYQ